MIPTGDIFISFLQEPTLGLRRQGMTGVFLRTEPCAVSLAW